MSDELKIGDNIKYRLDQQHMWFEVVKVLPDRFTLKLLNEPLKGQMRMPDGSTWNFNSDYSFGDTIEVSKKEWHEYKSARPTQ